MNLSAKQKHTHVENKLVVAKGEMVSSVQGSEDKNDEIYPEQ